MGNTSNTNIKLDNRILFLDDYFIESMSGYGRRVFHKPVDRGIAMIFDKPWEGNSASGITIFKDDNLYRMYYRASGYVIENKKLKESHPYFTAYAESKDGISWTRPDLGFIEFNGSSKNNILPHQIGHVFKDSNPNVKPDEKYKSISIDTDHRGENIGGGKCVYAWKSADGISWQKMQQYPIYDKNNRGLADVPDSSIMTWLDSHNVVYWSEQEKCYVMYYRVYTYNGQPQTKDWEMPTDYYKKRVRQVEKAVSNDFVNWRRVDLIEFSDDFPSVQEQIYNNMIAPYWRAPNIMIGMPGRYTDRGWTASHDQFPDLSRRKLESSVLMRAGTALTDTLFIWSYDGIDFKRSPETFLAPGPQRSGSWMYGDHWVAHHLVETESEFKESSPELSIYTLEFYRKGPSTKLHRYTLRLDGFASIYAPMSGGEIKIKEMVLKGNSLSINFATSAAGKVLVAIADKYGKTVPGYSFDDCDIIIGDQTDRIVSWQGNSDLNKLSGKTVKLKFSLNEADLYSFVFRY